MRQVPDSGAWFLLMAALLALSASAAGASRNPSRERTLPVAPSQPVLTAVSTLQTTISYTQLEVRVDQPLAVAKGGVVSLGVKYAGVAPVASVQVPGAGSYPIGPFAGSFEHTIGNADARMLLKRDDAQILARCKSTLDFNKVDVINTVHDATIPFTVNSATRLRSSRDANRRSSTTTSA